MAELNKTQPSSGIIYEYFDKTAKISRISALTVAVILTFLLPLRFRYIMVWLDLTLLGALLFQLLVFPFIFKYKPKLAAYLTSLIYLTPIYIIIGFTGGLYSPLFFLMFFPPIGVAMSVGHKGAYITVAYQLAFCFFYLVWQPPMPEPHLSYALFKILSVAFLIGPFAAVTARRYIEVKIKSDQVRELASQLQDANVQIKSVDKMKSDLLNMASHEFRTPLSAIKTSVWFLNKGEVRQKLDDKAKTNLERITKSVERLVYLQDNLNQMLQTAAGELTLDLESVQVEKVIQEAVESKSLEAQEKQINLDFEEPEALLPLIVADPTKLKYVIWELLTNALKYTEAQGNITVKAWQDEDQIKISVGDTGKGIPQDQVEQLFHGFEKIDYFHTTQPGFGLGLYIIKRIIDMHQGQIEVESKIDRGRPAAEHGTTLTITLPVQRESEDPENTLSEED